jgi:hypothetical protein
MKNIEKCSVEDLYELFEIMEINDENLKVARKKVLLLHPDKNIGVDTSEYYLTNTILGSDIEYCTVLPYPAGLLNCHFKANVSVTPGAFANPIKLATFKGVTVFPGLIPHDGISDFKITLNQLKVGSSVNVPGVANQFQDVEVQNVPGPLPILGAAAAFRFCRKARKLSARNKTLSMG